MFQLGVVWPLVQDRLVLRVMDADTLGSDDIVGSIPLSLKDIVKTYSTDKGDQKEGEGDAEEKDRARELEDLNLKEKDAGLSDPEKKRKEELEELQNSGELAQLEKALANVPNKGFVWKQVYGAPVDSNCDGAAEAMNVRPERASDWKGRVLLHLQACEAQYPECGVVPASEAVLQLCEKERVLEKRKFGLMAEIGAGICLPGAPQTKYRVQVMIGHCEPEQPVGKENDPKAP